MGIFSQFKMMGGTAPVSRECVRVGTVLQSYLDNELDADQTAWVFDHLDDCRDCGLEAEIYSELKEALRQQGNPAPDSLRRLREFADRLVIGDLDDTSEPSA
jgi:hypothetical protein